MTIHNGITELVGQTPLLRLSRFSQQFQLNAELVAKLEYFNPNHSIKDRIALAMIEEAERSGKLKPGMTLVDTTSGNTGIGLAAIAAAKGYKFRVYLHDKLSAERFAILNAFGAEIIPFSQVPGFEQVMADSDGDFVAAARWLADNVILKEANICFTCQLENPANPAAHFNSTGPEIWQQTDGQLDLLIASVGTGGTLSGVGRYLKQQNPAIRLIGVEPGEFSIPDNDNPETREITGVHAFSSVLPERVPLTLDRTLCDEAFAVESWQAIQTAREVAATDGILVGESSGAVLYAAREIARRPENAGKRMVVILADSGLTYLSTGLFDPQQSIGQIKAAALLRQLAAEPTL
ncbi:cysteine synthase family protein [Erwiniaceae bacterium BAC15a-03b]|uniref:cysteine synthase n=1 Tax=Winslowiella arboricola TaxID=2978220 RepID=A0A9J6PXZ3_9GAMM|nr:cysteine synthase family protein [Winslowiella arboricola]MCU5772482.1 cysteine synthase family protein [Winslowiella arboricola]MCU5779724.1 cysteine synthase family protein [Winslowiella arboricola]